MFSDEDSKREIENRGIDMRTFNAQYLNTGVSWRVNSDGAPDYGQSAVLTYGLLESLPDYYLTSIEIFGVRFAFIFRTHPVMPLAKAA